MKAIFIAYNQAYNEEIVDVLETKLIVAVIVSTQIQVIGFVEQLEIVLAILLENNVETVRFV